jgi:polyvinyl alcohol dehydrogenase (cytochrome)
MLALLTPSRIALSAAALAAFLPFMGCGKVEGVEPQKAAAASADPSDWPTYNYDVTGTRHNAHERAINPKNAAGLEEKWRFPAVGSKETVGVIHATPIVVNGYVYFGTSLPPAVYKLTPDGQLKWVYRNPEHSKPRNNLTPFNPFGSPASGFMNAVLVTDDTVYIGDLGGVIYALDRFTGEERWKIDTRSSPFPGYHTSNCIFSAPVLVEGMVVVGGGGFEHGVALDPNVRCCTGRGFVVALAPGTGKVLWKYEVGPTPQPLDPPVRMKSHTGEHVFYFGPSTSSVWSTSSYDASTRTVFFGTDTHNAPRQPTKDDPRLYTEHSSAVIALDARTGKEKWVTQITPDDVWNYAIATYDRATGRYKDQSVGDTPKVYTIEVDGKSVDVVGVGTKNGGFYVLDRATGKILRQTPVYTGPPSKAPENLDPRTLALPSAIGGLQTGCATDGKAVFTNGIDFNMLGVAGTADEPRYAPSGGRVVSISLDTRTENWRHERPKIATIGGTKDRPMYTDVGDPVGSGIALANGVAYFTTTVSNRLVALDAASGTLLKEIPLGPVWCGPSVSRGRVYVGSGNTLFNPFDPLESYFPKGSVGTLYSFGLPGEDEVGRMGKGSE